MELLPDIVKAPYQFEILPSYSHGDGCGFQNLDLLGLAPVIQSEIHYADTTLVADIPLPQVGVLMADVILTLSSDDGSQESVRIAQLCHSG